MYIIMFRQIPSHGASGLQSLGVPEVPGRMDMLANPAAKTLSFFCVFFGLFGFASWVLLLCSLGLFNLPP